MSAYFPPSGDVIRILLAAAERVDLALRTESDRLAASGDERSIEHGIGVLKAINAARKAVLAESAYAPCPACGASGSGNFNCVTCHQTWRAAWGHVCAVCEESPLNKYDPEIAERIAEQDAALERVTAVNMLGACQEAARMVEKYVSELEERLEDIRILAATSESEEKGDSNPGVGHSPLVVQITNLLSHLTEIQKRIRRLEQQIEL